MRRVNTFRELMAYTSTSHYPIYGSALLGMIYVVTAIVMKRRMTWFVLTNLVKRSANGVNGERGRIVVRDRMMNADHVCADAKEI